MKKDIKPILQMCMCAILWSIAGIFMKKLPWNGLAIASARALVAMCFFIVYMILLKAKFVVNKKTIISSIFASCTYICFCVANKLTTAANVIVLQYTAPIFILIFMSLFFHEKIDKRDIIAVLITLIGMVLCFADGLDSGKMIGNVLSVVAGMFFAAMFVSMGNITMDERLSTLIVSQFLTFLVGLPSFIISQPQISAQSILFILILGIFQIGFAFVFYVQAAEQCSALACCLISLLEPLLNPIWVMIFDGETPGVLSLIGGIIVLVTVTFWSVLNKKEEA